MITNIYLPCLNIKLASTDYIFRSLDNSKYKNLYTTC